MNTGTNDHTANKVIRCPFCGLDPYEYVDYGVGFVPIAVNCCEDGYMMFAQGMTIDEIKERNKEIDDKINGPRSCGFCGKEGCYNLACKGKYDK